MSGAVGVKTGNVKKKPMTLEELQDKINNASWYTVPEEVLFNYRNAESKEQTAERVRLFREQMQASRKAETTLSGTPKPVRFPFRFENIEEAQIETA